MAIASGTFILNPDGSRAMSPDGNFKMSNGVKDCRCCWRQALRCDTDAPLDFWMTKADAAGFPNAMYIPSLDVCAYFDDPVGTLGGTLYTSADATAQASCVACSPADLCRACDDACFAISGYTDGMLAPTVPGGCAAAALAFPVLCNGVASPPIAWDGSFRKVVTVGVVGDTFECAWFATCDNTPAGDALNGSNGLCVDDSLLILARLSRGCNVDPITLNVSSVTKTIDLQYIRPGEGFSRQLWIGSNTGTANQDMDVVYTRTGGEDTTATLTITATCPVSHCYDVWQYDCVTTDISHISVSCLTSDPANTNVWSWTGSHYEFIQKNGECTSDEDCAASETPPAAPESIDNCNHCYDVWHYHCESETDVHISVACHASEPAGTGAWTYLGSGIFEYIQKNANCTTDESCTPSDSPPSPPDCFPTGNPCSDVHCITIQLYDETFTPQGDLIYLSDSGVEGGCGYAEDGGSSPSCFPTGGLWLVNTPNGWYHYSTGDSSVFPPNGYVWPHDEGNDPGMHEGWFAIVSVVTCP